MIKVVRFDLSRFVKKCEDKSCDWAEREYNSLEEQIAYFEAVEETVKCLAEIFKIPKKRKKQLNVSIFDSKKFANECTESFVGKAKKYESVGEQLAYRNGSARVVAQLQSELEMASNFIRNNKCKVAAESSTIMCIVWN